MTVSAQGRFRLCHNCLKVADGSTSRCTTCRKARKNADRKRNRAISRAVFPAALRERLLKLVKARTSLADAARILQVTPQQVHGFARTNPQFRRDLDKALMVGRDPDLNHGSATTYRKHGCRCPECRAAKRQSGAWDR